MESVAFHAVGLTGIVAGVLAEALDGKLIDVTVAIIKASIRILDNDLFGLLMGEHLLTSKFTLMYLAISILIAPIVLNLNTL